MRIEYTSPNIIYRHISVYVSVPAAVSGGYRSAHCTQASFLYIPIYWCIWFFFLVFFPLKPLPPSFTRLEGSIPHTHSDTWICTCLLVVYDYNSSFGGRLRHRLVAPVFHGSATLTRPMLQPYLNMSKYIWNIYIVVWGHIYSKDSDEVCIMALDIKALLRPC